jgi:uncharacterized caspase-like protein
MVEYLTNVMAYPNENIALLTNENASLTDIAKYIEDWLPQKVSNDSTVFVYYSGHGVPHIATQESHLLPYDGDPAFIKTTGYSLNRLYEKLGELPVKEIIVVLDSCFSGAGGRSILPEGARPVGLVVDNKALRSQRMAVLAASSGTEASTTYREQGHGTFTYFFLKGLQTEADVNQDGIVELGEIIKYLKLQVPLFSRKHHNSEQNPQLLAPPGWERNIRLVETP